jgi:hypothetical protein
VSNSWQYGDVNMLYVTQGGYNSGQLIHSKVVQSGAGNFGDINQGGDYGYDQYSNVLQQGIGNATYVTQRDWNQLSYVEQYGLGNYAKVTQGFQFQDSWIKQEGESNHAQVDQFGYIQESNVQQYGLGNFAKITQSGPFADNDNNFSDVIQSGQFNSATVDQGGEGGDFQRSWIVQEGAGNVADVLQRDDDEKSIVLQYGNGNFADVDQGYTFGGINVTGLHDSYVRQSGESNISLVHQEFEFNKSAIVQNGVGNFADVYQYGLVTVLPQESYITQSGEGNWVDADQIGYYNYSSITQDGLGNGVDLYQNGTNQISNVLQNGTGNYSNVNQF